LGSNRGGGRHCILGGDEELEKQATRVSAATVGCFHRSPNLRDPRQFRQVQVFQYVDDGPFRAGRLECALGDTQSANGAE
jgi:hypothetical protein